MRIQKIISIIGFIFIFLYFIYVGGYSTAKIFKYSLVIGLLFLTVDLILYIFVKKRLKNKSILGHPTKLRYTLNFRLGCSFIFRGR